MSNGPIQRERDAWKPPVVSTPDAKRLCGMSLYSVRPYCGRNTGHAVTDDWEAVTCADCLAARRADQESADLPSGDA